MELSCAKCGSKKIVADASITERGLVNVKALIYANPQGTFFKGTTTVSLFARICGECGYTEIYAENPGKIYDAFLRSRQTA